jgi:hypothetical protein
MSYDEGFSLIALYMTGLAPFWVPKFHVASLAFISGKYHDGIMSRINADPSFLGKFALRFYSLAATTFNWMGDGMIENLNKRGIHTCYWVLNENEEIVKLRERSAC